MRELRHELLVARTRIGSEFERESGRRRWLQQIEKLTIRLDLINSKVHKLNMVVPALHMQIIPYTSERIMRKTLEDYNERQATGRLPKLEQNPSTHLQYDSVPVSYQSISFWTIFSEIRALFASKKS